MLTPTEFRLLECLLRQPGRAFTRHQLMDAAIGDGAIVLERTIDVHIKTLRRKLGDMELIETVRGVGYRFREGANDQTAIRGAFRPPPDSAAARRIRAATEFLS